MINRGGDEGTEPLRIIGILL